MDTTTTTTTGTEQKADTFGTDAKMAAVTIGNTGKTKRGKIIAALFRVVAAEQKDSVNAEWKKELEKLRKSTDAEFRNTPDYLSKVAYIESTRTLQIIRDTLGTIAEVASQVAADVPDIANACELLLTRPRHTMSHGTQAADHVADFCGVTIDTKKAVAANVKAAQAEYAAELGE